MARKTQHSFAKRQRELKKARKAEKKRADKEARKHSTADESDCAAEQTERDIETPTDPV